jgi:CRP/FNR family transcriptional regulator, cyclic AMP receptor protein
MLARDTTVQEVLHTLTPVEQAALVKSFFASFPASARDQLLAEALRVEIPAGTVWYREADEPQRVSLVVSGLLRLYLAAPDGRQLTVRYARSGDALGIATSAGGPGILTKQVVTDCALLVFRRPTLLALGQRDVRVAWAIAEEITHRLFVYMDVIAATTMGTVRQRVARHLLDLSCSHQQGTALLAPVSQQELADAVGSVREVVARALRQLRDAGLVETNSQGILIHDPIGAPWRDVVADALSRQDRRNQSHTGVGQKLLRRRHA